MNDKVKMAATLLPVILVPLFNERKRIKEHPDMQKLGETSSTVYHTAKDKGTNAAKSVKDVSTSTYQTGKSAVSAVGGAIAEKRHEQNYKKEQKQYQKSLDEAQSLLERFEKEKEKHRKNRLREEPRIKVPKIMQSHSETDNTDRSSAMTVSDENRELAAFDYEAEVEMKSNPDNYGIAAEYDEDQSNNRASLTESDETRLDLDDQSSPEKEAETEMKSNPDNYGVAMEYDSDQPESRARLEEEDETSLGRGEAIQHNDDEQERFDHMNQNMNHLIDQKVRGHEFEDYESGDLFKAHKAKLDPKHAQSKGKTTEREDSLFNRHRALQEEQVVSHGRRTGVESAISKSRKQKKLEKKIDNHLKKQYN